jgi:hypothetical protein
MRQSGQCASGVRLLALNALSSIAIHTSDPSTRRRASWMAPRCISKNRCTIFSACMIASETIDPIAKKKKTVMHALLPLQATRNALL